VEVKKSNYPAPLNIFVEIPIKGTGLLLNSSLEFLKVRGKEDVEFKFFQP